MAKTGARSGPVRAQSLRKGASFTKRLEEARRRRMLLLGDARATGPSDDELPFDLRGRAALAPDLIDEAEVARRHGPAPEAPPAAPEIPVLESRVPENPVDMSPERPPDPVMEPVAGLEAEVFDTEGNNPLSPLPEAPEPGAGPDMRSDPAPEPALDAPAAPAPLVAANLSGPPAAAPVAAAEPAPLMLDHTARIVPATPVPDRAEPAPILPPPVAPRAPRPARPLAATPRFQPAPRRKAGYGAVLFRTGLAGAAAFGLTWWALNGALPVGGAEIAPFAARGPAQIEVTALGAVSAAASAPALAIAALAAAPQAPLTPGQDAAPALAAFAAVAAPAAAPRADAPTPAAALPTIGAPVALPPARVSVSAPTGRAPWELSGVIEALNAAGFDAFSAGAVSFAISEDQVRYYHAADAFAATAVAATFGGRVRDFTGFSPKPAEGTLEVWLSGRALPQAARPVPVAPPAPAVLPPTLADRMFGSALPQPELGN